MISSELRFLPGNRAAFADQDGRSRFERTEPGGTKPADRSCESKCGNLQRGECMKTPSASPGAGGFFMSDWLAALAKSEHGFASLPCSSALLARFRKLIPKRTGAPYEEIIRPSFFCGLQPSDLAIAIPAFHIAPVRELRCGLQRFGIAIGLNRLIRDDAIVSINHVSSIGRHGGLPSPRQRPGNGLLAQAAMQEPVEPTS